MEDELSNEILNSLSELNDIYSEIKEKSIQELIYIEQRNNASIDMYKKILKIAHETKSKINEKDTADEYIHILDFLESTIKENEQKIIERQNESK